ncbi:Ig-like domain-containing protein [Cronobacter turicensis]|uniref:Ig-like domain-containing protein n=1 Tax=Cronobacter turicensis TaxID=413502 RepID=UPI0024C35684|nr:Ig-like domain-containing protein [Cronobacter turicensis]MDK1334440.1 Ig-like domain-containing protein [Cronobacter turicensis]
MAVQNSLSPTVDILNQDTGNVITHYSQNADRVVNLSQTSIVRINASPETVNSYERQGNDLIVHMKDGTTVRYQNFFHLDAEGQHSELIFEDDKGVHHALFPFASEPGPAVAEAITPTLADTSLGALTGAEGLTTLQALGGIAAIGAISGVAIAASNSSDGGGNNDNNNGGDNGGGDNGGGDNGGGDNGGGETPDPAEIALDPLTDDNILNSSEVLQNQVLSGVVDAANAGRTITVTLNGNTYTGVIGADGGWSVTLPASALQTLPQGLNTITVTLVDVNGNTVNQTVDINVDTVAPGLQLIPFTDGVLGGEQAATTQILRGATGVAEEGQTVTVTLNGKTYTATVGADGNWQAAIPSADLLALQNGQEYVLNVSITDLAGNTTTSETRFTVNFDRPVLAVNDFTGDNVLDGSELAVNQILSGTTQNIASGTVVTVTLNGQNYFATVGGDGTWQVTIPSGDLQALANGTATLTVSVPDGAGAPLTVTDTLTVDRTVPSVSIAILSTDDYLNAAEATQPLEIRGVTTVTGPGAQVTVTFNDKTYTAVLDSAGNWSVLIPAADLATLPDGPRTVTATVTSGQTTATADRVINVEINDLPDPTIVTPFGDGVLSAADLQQNQTLTGNTGVSGSGQTVTVQLGSQTFTTTAGADGGWSVTIPASQLQTLPPGQTPIVVTATDGAGNSASTSSSVTVDSTPPALSLYALTDDGKLNAQELTTDQVLSGNSSEAGQTVTVTLNGQTYTTTTGSDGNWQITLPAADLGNLAPGANAIVVTTTDAAGNTAQVTDSVNVKTTQPSVTVTPFTGDNALDAAEIKTAQPLQGSVTNAEPGSVVTVAIGAWSTTATVDAAGNWRVDVPAVVLQGLANGDNVIQVSVTDTWNQTTTIPAPITVDTAASGVAISIISDDDFINRTEADSPLTIRGTSAGLPANTDITVTLNGINYTATVDASGNWQTTVPAADLQGLADGNYEVTATAQQGGVSDSHTLTVIINNLPDTTIDPLFTDGTLSQAEAGVDQVLTGKTGVTGAGQAVTVTLNGQAYQGTVDANGNWSVTLPSGALDALTGNDSPVPLQIVVRDAAGNSQTTTTDFTVDVEAPTLTINPFAQDDALNITEASQAQAFSGVASGAAQGDAIAVTLNGKTYTTTVTGANGEWSVNIPAADLQALPNGQAQFNVTVTDAAGNTSTATRPITVAVDPARAPLLTLDPIGGDGVIDAGERASGVTLSGTATNVTAGQTVTITLGNDTFTGVVDSAGRWEVNLPADALTGLANGTYTITAAVSDAAGNSVSLDRGFSVDTDISALTVAPVTGDNRVSLDDIAGGLVLSGSSVNFAPQTTLTITLNGKQYTATTGPDGSWSVTVPRVDALDISDGKATLTVSGADENGAVVSGNQSFTIITTDLPDVTLNTPFTDGIISAAEVSAGGALSGSTGVSGAGQTVTVQFNGATYNAVVDSSGNWAVTLPPAALQGLTEGETPLVVTATDAAGNQNTSQSTITVDLSAPVLTVNDITADNIVNATEAAQPLTISGSATPYDPQNPQTVQVQIGGQSYSALVQSDGTWSVTLPAGALTTLPDGPVSVIATVSDAAGNTSSERVSLTLDASPVNAPLVAVNTVATDNFINATEAQSPLQITGTTTRVEAGQTVSVTLNGQTYTGEVQPNGTWSVTVPNAALAQVADGQQIIGVTVTDVSGNQAFVQYPVTFTAQPGSQPQLTLNAIAGDDIINSQESGQDLAITGTSLNLAPGTIVSVVFNNVTYTGTTGANGQWSVTVPASALSALPDDAYTVTATARDAAQNTATDSSSVSVDTTVPANGLNPGSFLDDGILNVSESLTEQTLGGTTTAGSTVELVIGGQTLSTVAGNDGTWSITIPAAQLQALDNGPQQLTLNVTAPNGNTSTLPLPVTVGNDTVPTVAIGTVFTDGLINLAEIQSGGVISGTSTGLTQGTPIVVTIGDVRLDGTIGAGGAWQINVGADALDALQNGQYALNVTAQDQYGNPATAGVEVDVLRTLPTAAVPDPLFGDSSINQSEAALGQQLTGNTGLTGAGQTVQITIDGGQPITGTVDNNGNWTVALTPAQIDALAEGNHTLSVTVSDRAGNSVTSPDTAFTVYADPLPTPVVTVPFTDGVLNAAEAAAGGTLSGTTDLPAGRISTVMVSLNNGAMAQATVDADGNWSLPLTPAQLQALPDGAIPVTVVVTDTAGNTNTGTTSFEARVNAVPDATINTPFIDGALNNAEAGAAQTITGSTGVSGAGQTVAIVLNGTTYTGTVLENGDWSVTLPSTAFTGLTPGSTQNFDVNVSDAYGNADSQPGSFQVQTQLPTPVATTLFGDNDILNISEANGALTLAGTTGITGNNQYVTVTIDVNGTTYVANVDNAGNWTLPLPAGALSGLTPGEHTLTIVAQDNFGNSKGIDVTFQAALTPPQVALTQPLFGDGYVNITEAGAASAISGTLTSDLPAGSQITVTLGNQTFGPDRVTVTGNTWTLNLTADDWAGVPNGLQSVNVTLVDGAGNTAAASAPLYVSLAAPTLTIDAPFGGDGLSGAESQQTQTITGTVTNVEPGQTITVTLGGQTFTTTVQNGNTWSLQLSPAQLATLANGPEQITATVTDKAGNVATAPAVNVEIDTTPPAVAVAINPVAGDNIINAGELGDAVTISGTTLGGVTEVTVQINGATVGTATVQPDGSWSLDVPATQFPDQGNYTIVATTDGATPAATNVTVTLDTVAPDVTISAVAGDNIIDATEASQPLVLSGTASTSEAGRQVTVTFNGQTYYAVVGNDGAWNITVPQSALNGLSDGTYPVTATLTDAAGNTDTATRNVTLDTTGPLLTVDAAGVPAVLNTVNAAGGLLLQGTGEPGQTVTLRLGPLTETATVDENGNWKYTFPQLDLTTLTDGAQVINISSTDAQGNTSTNNVALNVALNQGLGILVNDLFGGDGILNVAESLVTQTLTGQLSGDYRGATVTATLVGTNVNIPLNALVAGDGRISVDFPPSLWQGIVDNTLQVQLNVTDAFGNVRNEIIDINLALTDVPVVSQVLVGTDNLINFAESTVNQTISGVVSNAENVSSIIVNFAGQRLTAVVDEAGRWTATLPSTLLGALPDGQAALQVVVTDNAGNVNTTGATFNVAINNLPTINIGSLFGDGTLSIPELLQGVLSGTTTGLAGQTITIQIGNTPAFTATVGPNGVWSVNLPEAVQSALTGLATGNQTVTVTASDASGNTASATGSLTLDLVAPALTSLSVFGDGLLNATEALVSQTISGVVTNATAGSSVSVALGSRTFTGTVGTGGRFTIQLNPTDLASLAEGSLTPRVTITTPDGNTTTVNGAPVVVGITSLPTVAINTLFGGDGWLNATEANAGQLITGTSNLASGTVTLNVGGNTFTGAITNGAWSVNVPAATLKGLQDGTLTVSASVTDPVGNVATGSQVVSAIVQALPQVAVNPVFGDSNLSLSDLLSPQLISGTATNLAAGSALTVKLGALTFNTTVRADGTWQVSVPTTSLQGLTDGPLSVTVTARDAAGNTASASGGLTVNIGALPTLAITSLFGDNGLNATDILSAQTITGTSTNAVGSQVTVSLGGKNYVTTVGNDGTWQLSVPKTDLSGLLDGTLTVNASVTNPAGNSTSTSGVLNVITHSLPTVSLTSLFGNDGYLNVSEAGSGQTISGKISGAADGATVKVTLGTNTYNATVGSDGTWTLPVTSTILQGLNSGALKVGVSVTDKVGNVNSTSSDVTVKLTTPTLSFTPLASLNPLTLLSTGLTLRGGSTNLAPGSVVHLSLLNGTVNTTALTDSNGNWSTTLGLGLNILQLLSLSSVLNIYATDVAGNTGYLNVGLGGQIISTTNPNPTFAAMSVEHEASLLALSDENSQTATQTDSQQTAATAKIAAVAAITETNNEDSTTPADDSVSVTGGYTIGGISIDLADGTSYSGESVQGSSGSDTIHLATLGFASLDGGAGTDTLVIDGVNIKLDLTAQSGQIQHIEIVDLGKSGTNSLTLDLHQALTLTDKPEDDLLVKGVNGDQVTLVKGGSDIWEVSGQREVDGLQFDVWHNSSQSNTLGDVLIQHGLHVNMV